MKDTYRKMTDKDTAPMFSKTELSEYFDISIKTISRRLDGATPSMNVRNIDFYHIASITELLDFRKPDNRGTNIPEGGYENQHGSYDPNKIVSDNPDEMTPAERNLYWKAEDLKQATKLKERRNMVEARMLIPAHEVELSLAAAFKTVALTLDTLPDSLERDGIIASGDIETIISILDSSREQLANDLTNLSPVTAQIYEEYYGQNSLK